MARLNGGELLIDLRSQGDAFGNEPEYDLTNEEIKCILTKGLKVFVIFSGREIVIPIVWGTITETAIVSTNIVDKEGDSHNVQITFATNKLKLQAI